MGIIKAIVAISFVVAFAAADFKDVCLSSHNKLRALHSDTPLMIWDADLAASAQTWAQHLADTKSFQHDLSSLAGENLYGAMGPQQSSCAEAALSWYNEYKNYNYSDPLHGSTGVIGHFTQLLWKSSVKLGVGVATYQEGGYTYTRIVARYSPAGNLQLTEAYKDNVKQRIDPSAKIPSKYDLDPSLCNDAAGDVTCDQYNSYGFCNPTNKYYQYMGSYCAKKCKIC